MTMVANVGYLDDEAISALRAAYEIILAERGIANGSSDAEELATQLVHAYLNGVTDAPEIRQMLNCQQAA